MELESRSRYLFDIAPHTHHTIELYAADEGGYRGLIFHFSKADGRINGRLEARFANRFKGVELLPASLEIGQCLTEMWGRRGRSVQISAGI